MIKIQPMRAKHRYSSTNGSGEDCSHSTSTGTNIWEIIPVECQALKSPICHSTTVLYFTGGGGKVVVRVTTKHIFLSLGAPLTVSQFAVSGRGVWGVRCWILSRFCSFNNFLVFNLISNKLENCAGQLIELIFIHWMMDRNNWCDVWYCSDWGFTV